MPTQRPNEPIAPTTIPGQPLDPKIPPDQNADSDEVGSQEDDDVGTDERGNEMLSAKLQRRIPDRSAEPAVQESLDPQKSTTAANSNEVPLDASREARDDEGNAVEVTDEDGEAARNSRPDSEAGSQ